MSKQLSDQTVQEEKAFSNQPPKKRPSPKSITINSQKTQDFSELLSKLSLAGEMSTSIAHEVRNPMTTVRGLAQLLAMEHPEKIGYYQLMIEEIDRANQVLSEFLCLAKNSPITFTDVILNDILRRAIDLLYSQTLQQEVHLYMFFDDNVCLHADENKLMLAFMHILKNAIEASQRGGNVFVRTRICSNEVKVRIVDEGIGIEESISHKIMEPFFTTKDGNPGLGLSVAYKIIEDHGGSLVINSLSHIGTIVEVSFPLPASAAEPE